MSKEFPRKEFYIYTTNIPLDDGKVVALNDRQIEHSKNLKEYSKTKWEIENIDWINSPIPSVIDVESGKDNLTLHCGLTEYKYLLGMVKMATERKSTISLEFIHRLSTEIRPITLDGMFFLSRRSDRETQHCVGFYDIPSASKNAQMWINKIPKEYVGLVNGMFDMFGFPKLNLIRHFRLNLEEMGEIKYTGFSKGFDGSLDSQFNGYVPIKLEAREILGRGKNSVNFLTYKFDDLNELLATIRNNGKEGRRIKEDIYGNVPEPNEMGFVIVDDCIGTLLSNKKHLTKNGYIEGLEILKKKGYKINEIPAGNIHLDDLV